MCLINEMQWREDIISCNNVNIHLRKMCKQFITRCRKNTSVQVWDLGTCVQLTLIQSIFQAFSLNDRFNYNTENITTMHFGTPGNNKHTNMWHVSNIYIPEQDMGDLIRKLYCRENTTNCKDSEGYLLQRCPTAEPSGIIFGLGGGGGWVG